LVRKLQKKSMTYYNSRILIASIVAMFGILIDILLSLYAYSLNPTYFILNESNQEFVNFFLTGDFPFFTFLAPLSIVFIHFIQRILLSKVRTEKFLLSLTNIYVFNMIWICSTRTMGGLSWFIPVIRGQLLSFMKFSGFILLLIYVGAVVLCVIEEEILSPKLA